MKIPGLIGGMSWESTATYYRLLNETVKAELGGFHSACCLLYSVDFAEIEACQSNGEWDRGADILSEAALRLQAAGDDPGFLQIKILNRGIDVLIPDNTDIELINNIIYKELCLGLIRPESKSELVRIIADLARRGAQRVILGCTEIGLLVSPDDTGIPLFDTTKIHAAAAVKKALDE